MAKETANVVTRNVRLVREAALIISYPKLNFPHVPRVAPSLPSAFPLAITSLFKLPFTTRVMSRATISEGISTNMRITIGWTNRNNLCKGAINAVKIFVTQLEESHCLY